MYEADPYDGIWDVTSFLLNHLQPMPSDHEAQNLTHRDLNKSFPRLPNELCEMVVRGLYPIENFSLECSRTFGPDFWLGFLVSSQVVPWLWDLDREECARKQRTKDKDGDTIAWDWELLVRQLSQTDVFEPTGGLSDAPLGLRNRRRIWRILSDIEFSSSEVIEKEGAGNDDVETAMEA